ncbi:MAG: DUF2281 domain-containing protein [Deltaproteobacteria bacterium RIFCSPLOWO2_02_FULL_53_8]|nr:MAG: DUF2281 domain-containing protein [Deltaproteobacteria bacterium RIFCSPLOWO2_02_FULL_53_8]
MNKKALLIDEIEHVPEPLLDEILDYVLFLKARIIRGDRMENLVMSESSLKKDWLRPEEDKAWEDL